jgi:prepilin-type N-terminal cleavage/methylation domain-containing protein
MVDLRDAKSKKRAFTLVEIVFTIAIIGILLAIFLPTMSAIKLAAQKVKDQSHLKTIATAWKTYTVDNNWGTIPITQHEGFSWVVTLAGGSLDGTGWQGQEKCILNDPYVYVSSSDKYASKVIKEAICSPAGDANAYLEPYARIKNAITMKTEAIPLSYCLILGLSGSVPLATTPVAFTRGLKENGKWHSKYGLYGDKGGYVVFGDGHTQWFDGSKPAKFLHWNGQEYTSDIREAVPSGALISGGRYIATDITDDDGSLLLIQHDGTDED